MGSYSRSMKLLLFAKVVFSRDFFFPESGGACMMELRGLGCSFSTNRLGLTPFDTRAEVDGFLSYLSSKVLRSFATAGL